MTVTVKVWEYDNPLNGKPRTSGKIELMEATDRGNLSLVVYTEDRANSLGLVLSAVIETLRFTETKFEIRTYRTPPPGVTTWDS